MTSSYTRITFVRLPDRDEGFNSAWHFAFCHRHREVTEGARQQDPIEGIYFLMDELRNDITM